MRTRLPGFVVCSLVVALAVAGCSRSLPDATPEGVVRLWLERMEASTDDPRAMHEAYSLLGPVAREKLAERARRMTTYTGKRADPEEMLAPGRFGLKFRPKTMRTSAVAFDGATVEILGSDPSEHASVRCVRIHSDLDAEDGWRIEPELPDSPAPTMVTTTPKRDARDGRDGG